MASADFERVLAALVAKKVRVTIDALPATTTTGDHETRDALAADRLARHELGIRGVWVHDLKDLDSTHSLEMFGADPEQQKQLLAAGAMWVGPRHMRPV